MEEGRQKVNLGWSILLIYFCLSKMVGWARMCNIVPFCLALDNLKVESAKSNLEDLVALDQTLCFRARKRNGLYLFSPLLAAVPVKLQSVSPVVYFFCLEHVIEQMIKGSILLCIFSVGFMYFISNQFSLCLCILSVCQCSTCMLKHWIPHDVEVLAYAAWTVQALGLCGSRYG